MTFVIKTISEFTGQRPNCIWLKIGYNGTKGEGVGRWEKLTIKPPD